MPLKEPTWWYSGEAQHRARLLRPVSRLYGHIAAQRFLYPRPYTSTIPVICVGNFTAGGTGKTPLTLLLANRLREAGERPGLLTRGYGGSIRGPHLVDAIKDSALKTGDEALLLARAAPTVVSSDRPAGAKFFEAMTDAPSVIIMDDGLQNPSLAKMLRIAVVDARRGIGNGEVIPSGPLRAPLEHQLALADAIIVNVGPMEVDAEPSSAESLIAMFRLLRFDRPILRGGIVSCSDLEALRARPVLAFAGIGYPDRFFETLRLSGIELAESVSFKDHHFFDAGDAEQLLKRADALNAQLVTTEKDHVRLLSYDDQRGELAACTTPFQISMTMIEEDIDGLDQLIKSALSNDDLITDQLMRTGP